MVEGGGNCILWEGSAGWTFASSSSRARDGRTDIAGYNLGWGRLREQSGVSECKLIGLGQVTLSHSTSYCRDPTKLIQIGY